MADDVATVRRQVFVAYAYGAYPKDDYRKVFLDISAEYNVNFLFADEKITNVSILQKIRSYIAGSDFSLFDISMWNPNVTLELGLAMAMGDQWYISYNPEKTDIKEVPSDIRGIDRIQYHSMADYSAKLKTLIEQQYPRRAPSIEVYLDSLREEIIAALTAQPGLSMKGLSELLGSDIKVTQLAMRTLLERQVIATGQTRGTRYWIRGTEPAR